MPDVDLIAEVLARHRIETYLVRHSGETPAASQRARLSRPTGMDPEEFSARVAQAYNEAAAVTHKPAHLLADEAGVPVVTVHRWVREARMRRYLPPIQRGSVGGPHRWRCGCGTASVAVYRDATVAAAAAERHQAEAIAEAQDHEAQPVDGSEPSSSHQETTPSVHTRGGE